MPRIARVQLPDGRIARFEVPDNATPQQVTAAAQRLSKPQAPQRAKGSGVGWIDNTLSSVNEALIGAGEGIYNAASAVTDPIAKLIVGEDAVKHAQGQRRKAVDAVSNAVVSRPMPVARTAGRIGGSLAIPLPGKKLQQGGKLAKAGYRAMQGAVGGAAVRDVDQSAAEPAAIGAAANVALPPALRLLGRIPGVQAVASAAGKAAAPVVNYLTGGSAKALPAPTRALQPLGRKAEARAARFKAAGVDEPTTAMVTRDPVAFKLERKLAQIEDDGDDLAQQIQGVEQSLVQSGRGLVDRMGGAKGAEAVGKAGQDVLDTKRGEMQQVTSRLYDKVREQRGDEVVGALENLNDLMADPDMTDNATFDGMRESLSRRMQRLGIIDADGAAVEGGAATVRQAEELRKFIGKLGSNAEPGVRMMRGQLIDALDDDVVNAVGDDAFKAARASAKARFDEFQKTAAGRIADERIPAKDLAKRLLSMDLDDLRSVKKSYLTGTDTQIERGAKAWKDLQAQGVDDLLKSAITDEGSIRGTSLLNAFKNRSDNLRVLLDPAEYKELRRLVLASRDAMVAPPSSSAYGSDTAPMIVNLLNGAGPKVKQSWFSFLRRVGAHGLAGAAGGPLANVALEAGRAGVGTIAEQRAASALARRIEMAKSPEAAARAIAAMRKAAEKNPAAKSLLDQITGPTVAATANQ